VCHQCAGNANVFGDNLEFYESYSNATDQMMKKQPFFLSVLLQKGNLDVVHQSLEGKS
jgi:hypothetical protein